MERAYYSKRMLCKQDCVKFRERIAWQTFFENNFADISDVVRVKDIKISSRWWRFQLATSPIELSIFASNKSKKYHLRLVVVTHFLQPTILQ